MNHIEAIEGFEAAIEALVDKLSKCEYYAEMCADDPFPSRSTANGLQNPRTIDSALPEFYAAVIVFAVKAHSYFEAKGTCCVIFGYLYLYHAKPILGIKKFNCILKPFDIEFQPFIDEIDAKERVIQECGDFATMKRVKGSLATDAFLSALAPFE